jgi:Ser/Thr protein kinase RdoA (MazF antagonist)
MEFPVSHRHYGLIHSDLHLGNFYVNNGKMTIFDFDDLQLGWFVFDIAISLYYIFWNSDLKETTWYQNPKERSEQAIYFLQQIIKGYQPEFKLPEEWLRMIPLFLELRQLDLYLVFEDRFENIVDQNSMPYLMINQYKQRILNQIPPVPLDVFDPSLYKIIRYQ